MTIRIAVKNDDDLREIEVQRVDPRDPATHVNAPTVIGPQGMAEFWLHSGQSVLVREVPAYEVTP